MPPVKPFLAIGTILVTAGLVTAAPARAQTREQKAGARAAADAGGDAFDAGKYAEAADLFERAERLVHAPPHLLYAARAHAKLGHVVEARELYLALTRERLSDSAPRVFREAQQAGEKELAEVEPRLAYVSLVVQGGSGATALRVTRNGEDVPSELLGVPAPVNPGDYSYQAVADGMESTPTSVKLREGARETVVLTLRDLPGAKKKGAAGPNGSAADSASGSSSLTTAPADSAPSSGGRPLLIGSIASFAVGAAGGVVGTMFLVKTLDTRGKSQDAYDACVARTGRCYGGSPEALQVEQLDREADKQLAVAITGLAVGGLGIAAGITLLVLDQNRSTATSSAQVTPLVGLNYVGLAGTF
jgi:hypothetical protein